MLTGELVNHTQEAALVGALFVKVREALDDPSTDALELGLTVGHLVIDVGDLLKRYLRVRVSGRHRFRPGFGGAIPPIL